MNLDQITATPVEIRKPTLDARQNGDVKEYTGSFTIRFNHHNIFAVLMPDAKKVQLEDLWDEEQNPLPGFKSITLQFPPQQWIVDIQRNAKSVLTFHAEHFSGWKVTPKKGGHFEVEMKPFGVFSRGDAEKVHKLVKDPSITVSFTLVPGVGQQTSLDEGGDDGGSQ